jgi:hypothetical protein
VSVLYGGSDTELTHAGLLGWRRQTGARPDLCALPAGHWLVDEDPAGVAGCVADRLLAGPGTPQPAARVRPPRAEPAPAPVPTTTAVDQEATWPAGEPADEPAADAALAILGEGVRARIGRPIGADENFFDAGLTSSVLVELHEISSRDLADRFPVTAMFAYPNLRALRRYLVEGDRSAPARAHPAAGGDQLRRTGHAWRELRARLRSETS